MPGNCCGALPAGRKQHTSEPASSPEPWAITITMSAMSHDVTQSSVPSSRHPSAVLVATGLG